MKQLALLFLLTASFLPIVSRAATVEELQGQIANLLKQVEALQAQIQAAQTFVQAPPSFCPPLTRTLFRGMSDVVVGGEVSALQQFLKSEGDYTYPEITGYFGPATELATKSWQARNGVVSSGTAATTGYGVVGPMTRAAIVAKCGGPTPAPTTLKPVPMTVPPIGIEIEPSATSSIPTATSTTDDGGSIVPQPSSIVCPVDGVAFKPSNMEFLGLVGNELQIAIYYGADLNYLARKYAEAGVRQVRIIAKWSEIEKTKGTYDWGYTDQRVNAMLNAGIKVLGIISATPQWASSCPKSPDFEHCIAANLDDYEAFVRAVVQRFGPSAPRFSVVPRASVRDWEIRVESNSHLAQMTKEQYVSELNRAYTVIKAVDPSARVWGPEVVFHRNNFAYPEGTAYQWVEHAIANGRYDVFSIHNFHSVASAYEHTGRVRKLLDAAGQRAVPLAVSAMNLYVENPPITQAEQARNLSDLYACVSSAGADYALWFAGTEWPDVNDTVHGIFDYDFSLASRVRPKMAYDTLKNLGNIIKKIFMGY